MTGLYIIKGGYIKVMYNPQEIKIKLNNYLQNYLALKDAWQNVSFKTKKDGSEFKNLSMAIDGAKFGLYRTIEDKDHPYLTVSIYKDGKLYTDHKPAYHYIDELPQDDKRREGYVRNFIRATTPMTLDELKASVEERIRILDLYANSMREQLEKLDEVYDRYTRVAYELRVKLDSELKDNYSTLYYEIKNSIREQF